MSRGEEQQKEIETIKERNISIRLSNADAKRLWEKAGSVGLTASELLENFIGDLVSGTYSNGSDERDSAQQWFDRCGFGMFPEMTFLRYLVWCSDLEFVIELLEDIHTAKEELEYADTHMDEFAKEEIEGWKEDLIGWEKQLNDTFLEYLEWTKDELTTGGFEEEVEKVVVWHNQMIKFSSQS